MEVGEILRKIMKDKKISQREIARRTGLTQSTICIDLKHPTYNTIKNFCNVLGVELCIIDGWKKYRLNDFGSLPELEIMFSEMNERVGKPGDRWKEKRDEKREQTRRKVNALMSRRCASCIHSELGLRKGHKIYCRIEEKYVVRQTCEHYEGRDERYLQKIHKEQDVQ